jgi:acyl-CoA dehydrogenase
LDFSPSSAADAIRREVRDFVDGLLIPLESDPSSYDEHDNIRLDLLDGLRREARSRGLWALRMPEARGGRGLSIADMAPCYEEANRSIFGPVTFNIAAPDDGNMIVLEKVSTEEQKARWLQPIIEGRVRSSFCMTEPAPGAGSDPGLMRTRAERVPGGWRITGRKWFITGAGVAEHFIVIARTSDDARRGLSAFLFHRDQPGWRILRRIPIMGPEEHGGHCELEFDGLEVPEDALLMREGDGLKLTQIRLGTARLTHCMRWLGLARRSIEIAGAWVRERDSFGAKLADRESVQQLLATSAMNIEIGRLLTMRAAVKLDAGDFARKQISMAKIYVADALQLSVDTAVQLCGARGYSRDTVLEWIYRYARQARLVDGASEVHKMVLARFVLDEGPGFWQWD